MTWTLRNLHNSQKKVLVDITIWLALSPYGDMALFTSFEYIIGEYYRYSILPLHQNLHKLLFTLFLICLASWKEGNRSCRYKWQKFVSGEFSLLHTNFCHLYLQDLFPSFQLARHIRKRVNSNLCKF